MAIKLIVLDLDGTLLKTKWKVDPYSLRVLERVYQVRPEIKIVLATGRAPGATITHAQTCHIDEKTGFIICYNGGAIFNIKNNNLEALIQNSLSKEQVKTVFDFAKKHHLNFWGYGVNNQTAYINRKSFKVWIIEHFNRLKKIIMTDENIVPLNKILLFCHSRKQLAAIEHELINNKELEISSSSTAHPLIEINPSGVNKAAAVQYLCRDWNIKPEEILVCGDGMNDYKLVKWAKYGIAMENAFDDLKAVAYDVTASNKKGGVGKAIEKYVFAEISN